MTAGCLKTPKHDLRRGAYAALCVAAGLFIINWRVASVVEILPAAFFCIVMYFFCFTLGAESVLDWTQVWFKGRRRRCLVFPALLTALVYVYILSIKGNPICRAKAPTFFYLAAAPVMTMLPVLLFFRHAGRENKAVSGWDFLLFAVVALMAVWFRFSFDRLPAVGASFQTASGLVMLLVVAYVATAVRRLPMVGFALSFGWKDLLFTLGCWLALMSLFVGLLYPAGLMEYVGHRAFSFHGFQDGLRYFLSHLLRVGMFEELVFRGIFQNMLARKTESLGAETGKRLLLFSAVFLAVATFFATFMTKDVGFRWLPPFVVLLVFAAANFIEKRFNIGRGEYIGLAVLSAVFGLVHYRFGVTFMTLACLAGWFYGFVYAKTRNVYLAALIHALLNCSGMFLGFQKNFGA